MSRESTKVGNIKSFELFAARWAKTLPPSRPSRGDLKIYQKLFTRHRNKIGPTEILILGATPELRDLAGRFGFNVTIADVNIEMIKAMASLRRYRTPEKVLIGRWQELPLKRQYDIIVGDVSLNMLDKSEILAMIKKASQLLKSGGYFLHRTAMYNPKRKLGIVKIIRDWRNKKIDIGDFRWLTELYSQYRSYDPATKVDSKRVLFNNVRKLYSEGFLTKTEFKKFGVYNDDVRITILTKSEWQKLFSRYFKVIEIIIPKGYLFCRDLPIFVLRK